MAPRRPTSRGARLDVAYQTGRRGEDEPSWMAEDDELHDAFAEGRREHDNDETEERRRRAQERRAHPRARTRPRAGEPPRDDEEHPADDVVPVLADERPPAREFDRSLFQPGDGGGLLLGALLYALGVAYLNEGAYGVKRWASAKFLNHVLPPSGGRGRRTQRTRPAAPSRRAA